MEMPEGWNKQVSNAISLQETDSISTRLEGIELEVAMMLMKEMDEALEKYENMSSNLSSIEYTARNVRKKFREWK